MIPRKNISTEETQDREIVISRVLDAPRERVFEAMTDPKQVVKWWGPNGFTTTIHEMDVKPGGAWRHTMHGPDGTDYPNKSIFLEVVKSERIVYQHAGGIEERGGACFKGTWTFEDQGGKTKLTMRLTFASSEERDHTVKEYQAIEGGKQTLERLDEYLEKKGKISTAGPELVITRIFDAPRELVWKAWTDPKEMMKWWGPKIFRAPSCKIDFRVGGKYLFCMQSEIGEETWRKGIWSTGVYKEIVPMEKIICTDCFADEKGNIVPGSYYGMPEVVNLEMLVTVTFEVYQKNKTKMTLHHAGLPISMKQDAGTGWNESFDKLAENLPVVIERTFDAPIQKVWEAITDKDQMKKWYFDLPAFKPKVGFEFQFSAGCEGRNYLHLCKITEVIPGKKLTYSWRYDGYEGNSFVTFELFAEGNKTRLKLTHEGLETFSKSNPDLAKENFVQGWTHILGTSLKDFMEK